MYHGKFDPKKGTVYLERDNVTDRLQKSVYIYTSVITGTDTGPSCHNPVESRLIPLDSGSIPVESGGMDAFLQESVGHQKVQPNSLPPKDDTSVEVEHSEYRVVALVAVACVDTEERLSFSLA